MKLYNIHLRAKGVYILSGYMILYIKYSLCNCLDCHDYLQYFLYYI